MSRNLIIISLLLFVPGFLVAKNRESLTNGIKAPMFHVSEDASYLGKNNFQYPLNSGLPYSEHVGFSANPHARNFSTKGGLSKSDRFERAMETWRRWPANDVTFIVSGRVGTLFWPDRDRFNSTLEFTGASFEWLPSPNFSLEASIKLFGAAAGVNVYFPAVEPGKLAFRAGLIYGAMYYWAGSETFTHIPIGITYLTRNNFVLGVDIGPFLKEYYGSGVGPSVKIGRAF
jgi:hypothetical protein